MTLDVLDSSYSDTLEDCPFTMSIYEDKDGVTPFTCAEKSGPQTTISMRSTEKNKITVFYELQAKYRDRQTRFWMFLKGLYRDLFITKF